MEKYAEQRIEKLEIRQDKLEDKVNELEKELNEETINKKIKEV